MRDRERLKARERRAAVAGTEKSEEKVLNSMFQPCEDMPKSVEGKQEKESPAQAKDDNGEIIVKKDTEDCEESHVEEGASGGKEEKRNDTEDGGLFHPHSYWPRVKLQRLENIVRTNNMEIKIRTLDQLQEEDILRERDIRDNLKNQFELKMSALHGDGRVKERRKKELEDLLSQVEKEKAEIQKRLDSQTSAFEQLLEKKEVQGKEIEKLAFQLEEERTQTMEAKNKLDLQTSTVEQLEKEKIDRKREVADLHVSFEEVTVEKMEIKNKLEQLQKEKGDHEREVSELLAKLEAEKEEKMQVKHKLRMMEERSLKNLESLKKTENMMETILAKYVRKKVV